MNVSLTSHLRLYVEQKVADGLYHSSSEVIREALRLMIERDKRSDSYSLDSKIQVGINQLDNGDVISDEELLEHIRKRRADTL